jgi:hypothetical protein
MRRSTRSTLPTYNYQQFKGDEKRIYRRLVIFVGVIIVVLVIIWFWGLSFIQIIGTLGSRGTSEPTTPGFQVPLFKPAISSLPEFTNKEKVTISGFTSSGAKVTLLVNGVEVGKSTANDSGDFTFVDVSLKVGLNFLKVVATDESGETKEAKEIITLDKKPPKLEILEPKDEQVFEKTKQIKIKGTTETETKVFINSIQTTIDNSGGFVYKLNVKKGENKIEIKSTDKAGNTKKVNLIVIVKD